MANLKTVNIKGKEYVEVNQRIKYFRENYEGSIITDIVKMENDVVVMKAQIVIDDKVRATGYAYEKEGSTFINKTSYIENCETSAIGRALGIFGIGLEASVASAEEIQNAIAQQDSYKTQSKQTDDDKKKYWNEFQVICKSLDVDAKDFLSEWAEIDLLDKKAMFNAVAKYLKDKEMFTEQLINYKDNKNENI